MIRRVSKVSAYTLILFGLVLFVQTRIASAATPYLANEVLGQTTNGNSDFTSGFTDNVKTPNALGLSYVYSTAVDPVAHKMFITDINNNRIVVHDLNSSNKVIDYMPENVLGQADFISQVAGISNSALDSPGALAIDTSKTLLYVADNDNNRILVYDYSSLTDNMSASYVLGQTDFTSNNGSTTQSTFSNLRDITLDSSGSTLYVSDASRVLVFDVSTINNGEAAQSVLGDNDFVGTATGSSTSTLGAPSGIGIDELGNQLFVADITYSRILVFDISIITNGEDAVNVLGKADYSLLISSPPATASSISQAHGLYYDSTTDYLYVADSKHYRVMIFDVATITNGEDAVYVLGQADFVSEDFDRPWQAVLSWPYDVTKVGDDLIVSSFYGSYNRIFDVSTIVNGEEGYDGFGLTDENGNYAPSGTPNNHYNNQSGLEFPSDVHVDEKNHRLFVADTYNYRVLVHDLDENNTFLDTLPDAILGQNDYTSQEYGTTQNTLGEPTSIDYDPVRDWLFVADADNGRVLVYDVAEVSGQENALYVLGQPDFTTGSTPNVFDQSTLEYPIQVAYDSDRQLLFVMEYIRVMVYDVASITNGEPAVYVLGQDDFVSAASDTTASAVDFLYGMAFDPVEDWLFLADATNDRVLVFDTTTLSNGMDASYVLGANDFTSVGDSGPNQSAVPFAGALAIDETRRRLYVYDSSNVRTLIFDIETITNNESAVGVLVQSDFVSSTYFSDPTQFSFTAETGMDYAANGNVLFVADPYDDRVLQFNFVQLQTDMLPTGNQNNAYATTLVHQNSQGTVTYSLANGTLPAGLSLSAEGVISGTPTSTETANFDIMVSDDNGVTGTFTDTRSYTLVVNGPDIDTDGVEDTIEDAGPNNGDANGDSIADSLQDSVSTNTNLVSSGYTTIETADGSVTDFQILDEATLPVQDESMDFPVGLNSFSITGLANGASSEVTIYYDQEYDISSWTFMKYSPSTDTYSDMSSAVIYDTALIGGNTVTTAKYTLTDGGEFDEDGIANGTIVDPAGPAVMSAGELADTGIPALYNVLSGIVLVTTVAVFSIQQKSEKPKRVLTK